MSFGNIHHCDKTGEILWAVDVLEFTGCGCRINSETVWAATPGEFFSYGLEASCRRWAREEALAVIEEGHEPHEDA